MNTAAHNPCRTAAPSGKRLRSGRLLLVCLLFGSLGIVGSVRASDHADPIDPLNKNRLEGGITDLFVFPVGEDDQEFSPFKREKGIPLYDTLADVERKELSAAEREKIKSLVFILCVRRQLIDSATLELDPYEYQIHIDLGLEGEKQISFPTAADFQEERAIQESKTDRKPPPASGYAASASNGHSHALRPTLVEAFARYGGKIPHPEKIEADITMKFRLTNTPEFQSGYPKFSGTAVGGWQSDKNIRFEAGVFEDPFIFPGFFGTNIVGIVVRVPIERFPKNTESLLIWANSWKGNQQIDHVGRSLRTQNPRFELLNTLHPKLHREAILAEHNNPTLLRDIALRLNFASMFAYRQWDFEPDVMCYTLKYPVGFPNGRLLSDDVAAILAQHGDTLLYELSYQHNNGDWPRRKINDRVLPEGKKIAFPYLLPPFPNVDSKVHPPETLRLSTRSVLKLLGILLLLILLFGLENVLFARWYHRRKLRRHYL